MLDLLFSFSRPADAVQRLNNSKSRFVVFGLYHEMLGTNWHYTRKFLLVSQSEISDITACARVQSNILRIKYVEKTDD